jgi:AmmeMemoRadiSam system protein A
LAALGLSERLGHLQPRLVAYANSGDTAGDTSRVVGYGALAFDERPVPPDAPRLSHEAGMALVRAARLAIDSHLRRVDPRPDLGLTPHAELAQPRGMFVTLRRKGRLRGCIGRIATDQPMAELLPRVALDAALHDERFSPVTAEELDQIHVEVSVLTVPQPVGDPLAIVPGRDGVVLQHEGRGGVFLPQVWMETGWTRIEFLREMASQKAGLDPDAWRQAQLFTFQDQIFEEPAAVAAH